MNFSSLEFAHFLQEILPYIEVQETLFRFLLNILQVFYIYIYISNSSGIYVLEFRDVIWFPHG